MVDSSKFSKDYMYKIGKTSNLDHIITDKGISSEIVDKCKKNKIMLETV